VAVILSAEVTKAKKKGTKSWEEQLGDEVEGRER